MTMILNMTCVHVGQSEKVFKERLYNCCYTTTNTSNINQRLS